MSRWHLKKNRGVMNSRRFYLHSLLVLSLAACSKNLSEAPQASKPEAVASEEVLNKSEPAEALIPALIPLRKTAKNLSLANATSQLPPLELSSGTSASSTNVGNDMAPASATSVGSLPKSPGKKKLSLDLSFSSGASLHSNSDFRKSSSSDLTVTPIYRISEILRLGAVVQASKDWRSGEVTLANTKLSLIRDAIELGKGFSYSPRLTSRVPTNELARKNDTYQGMVGLENRLLYKSGALSGHYQLALERNFHEFTRNGDRAPNVKHSLRHWVSVGVDLSDKWSIGLDAIYILGLTYDNSPKESFDINQEISYAIDENASLAIGHNNTGPLFKPNGKDLNAAFYDGDSSSVYGSVLIRY